MSMVRFVHALKRDQDGVTLVETLVAIAILGITMTGILAATLTSMHASSSARLNAQLNTLATAFGETIKALPYQVCATRSVYADAFDRADALTGADAQLRDKLGATLAITSVTDVDNPNTPCLGEDSGTQRVSLSASAHGRTVSAEIVKRTPHPVPKPTINIHVKWLSENNDPVNVINPWFSSSIQKEIIAVEWWCLGDFARAPGGWLNAPPSTFMTTFANDPLVQCGPNNPPGNTAFNSPVFDAAKPSNDPSYQRWIAVRVTDEDGRMYTKVDSFHLKTTLIGVAPPTARFVVESAAPCLLSMRCPAPVDVTFRADNSDPGENLSFDKCVWNFGDGSPRRVEVGPDCHLRPIPHHYVGQGDFTVQLTVTNSVGLEHTYAQTVYTVGELRVRPQVAVQVKINGITFGTPDANGIVYAEAVVPQRVEFRSDGTQPMGLSPVLNYQWNFGPTTPTVDHLYGQNDYSSNYECTDPRTGQTKMGTLVTLTVTDGHGSSNSASICMVLHKLQPPLLSSQRAQLSWGFFWIRVTFRFSWPAIPMSPGTPDENLRVRLTFSNSGGTCLLDDRHIDVSSPQPSPGNPLRVETYQIDDLGELLDLGFSALLGLLGGGIRHCRVNAVTYRTYQPDPNLPAVVYQSPPSADVPISSNSA